MNRKQLIRYKSQLSIAVDALTESKEISREINYSSLLGGITSDTAKNWVEITTDVMQILQTLNLAIEKFDERIINK